MHLKQPPVVRQFTRDGSFELRFGHNRDLYLLRLFVGRTEGVECASCWTPFIGTCARMMHQLQVHEQHCITNFKQAEKEHTNNF